MADAPVHRPAETVAPAAVAAIEAPVAAVAPEPVVADPVAPEATVALTTDAPTLLETAAAEPPAADAPKPEDAKPADGEKPAEPAADAPKPEDAAKPEDKPAEKPAEAKPPEPAVEPVKPEPVKYEAFELPEGVKLDDAPLSAATAILGEYGVPQDKAQALVALHAKTMQDYAAHLSAEQHRVFAETRTAWQNEVKADPVLGGAGFQTAMARVARTRDLFVPADKREAFNTFLKATGAGDHPIFLRMMHAIGERFDEPAPAPIPRNGPPDRGKGPGGRRKALYDHPTSSTNRA